MFAAVLIGWIIIAGFSHGLQPPTEEGRDYYSIAQGHYRVYYYYAGRVLHPVVVHWVAVLIGASLPEAFYITSCISVLLFLVLVAVFLTAESKYPLLMLPLAVVPALVYNFQNYYWQDMFHAMLAVCFFLVLRANIWLSLPLLLMLNITRESTVLLTTALVAVSLVRHKWRFSVVSAITGLVGMYVVAVFVRHALPNKHQIPTLLFDALKALYGFVYNVLGLVFWTDTNATTTLCRPRWTMIVPPWMHLGAIRQIGFCGFNYRNSLNTLVVLGCSFGIMPAYLGRAILCRWQWIAKNLEFYALVALLYGLMAFFSTPLAGTSIERYIFYAWPAFFLTVPLLLQLAAPRKALLVVLVFLSIASAWLPYFLLRTGRHEHLILTVSAEVALYIAATAVVRRVDLPSTDVFTELGRQNLSAASLATGGL